KIISNVMRGPGTPGIGVHKGRNITVAGNDVKGSSDAALTLEDGPTNVTVAGNDFTDNTYGMFVFQATGTRIVSNDMSRSDKVGIFVHGPNGTNTEAKVVANHVSGADDFGILVANSHGGSFVGNDLHNNCAGIAF